MLGENSNFDGVVVKQLVPKGAADRTGKVWTSFHRISMEWVISHNINGILGSQLSLTSVNLLLTITNSNNALTVLWGS